jgi:hypothetical protein
VVASLLFLTFTLIAFLDGAGFSTCFSPKGRSCVNFRKDSVADLEAGYGYKESDDMDSEETSDSEVNQGNPLEGKRIFGAFKEPFNLQKCLGYISNYLEDTGDFNENEVEEFIDDLSKRWMFVDSDETGLCSVQELRLAVWESDPESANRLLPDGPLPKAQQDIVDEILEGVKIGGRNAFTFWDLAIHVYEDREVDGISFIVPRQGWAYADLQQ